MITFRTDINGLRAVAVTAVLAFHLDVSGARGGFAGVDIFLVISGYLMTAILSQPTPGSVAGFYWSRISRITPPLLAVATAVLAVGYLFLDPAAYQTAASETLAATLFYSNVLFYYGSGDYFAPAAASNWMLHTWSLSLEAQFYLLFPVLFRVVKGEDGRRVLLAFVFLASFLIWCALQYFDKAAAFYLLPPRIWEFAAGALAFMYGSRFASRRNEYMPLVGLGLVAVSIFGTSSPFASLLAVCGAVAVVVSPSSNLLLVNGLSQLLGTISYSVYLWHWPLIVAARQFDVFGSTGSLAVLSIALGAASYWLIERPVRFFKRYRFASGLSMSVALAAIASIGFAIWMSAGVPSRVPGLIAHVTDRFTKDMAEASRSSPGNCFLAPTMTAADVDRSCLPSDGASVLVWGDSYAAHLWLGLVNEVPTAKRMTAASCPPIVGPPATLNKGCPGVNNEVLKVIGERHLKRVVLFARWSYYDQNGTDVVGALEKTVQVLRSVGVEPIVVGPSPEWLPTLPQRMFSATFQRGGDVPRNLPDASQPAISNLDSRIASSAKVLRYSYISAVAELCTTDCATVVGSGNSADLTVYDYGHLTLAGARAIASGITPLMR